MFSILHQKRPEIAIDFGTANLRIIQRDEGIVFDEPSLCCFSRKSGGAKFVAAGAEAYAMIDRLPADLQLKSPLRRGVLQDIDAARSLLRYALSQVQVRRRLRAPHAIFGVPADATQAERSALLTAASDAGLGNVRLAAEPFAAAIGAQLPIAEAAASMVIECGAGTTEVGVFSLGGLCESGSVRIGGDTLNQAIADQLHFQRKFLIGEQSAEQLKLAYVAGQERAAACGAVHAVSIKGRSLRNGLPMAIDIHLSELDTVVTKHIDQIVEVVRQVLGRTAPELSHDIYERGIVLTGGGALMPLMSGMVSEATGLDVTIAEQPFLCVAKGLHQMLLQ